MHKKMKSYELIVGIFLVYPLFSHGRIGNTDRKFDFSLTSTTLP